MPIYNGFGYRVHKFADGSLRQKRPWGFEYLVVATDTLDNNRKFSVVISSKHEMSKNEARTKIEHRFDRIRNELNFEKVEAKELSQDFGSELFDDFKQSLIWLIKYIRKNPNVTMSDLSQAFSLARPDALMDITKLYAFIRPKLPTGAASNFVDFKNYVVNKKFREVDIV